MIKEKEHDKTIQDEAQRNINFNYLTGSRIVQDSCYPWSLSEKARATMAEEDMLRFQRKIYPTKNLAPDFKAIVNRIFTNLSKKEE